MKYIFIFIIISTISVCDTSDTFKKDITNKIHDHTITQARYNIDKYGYAVYE